MVQMRSIGASLLDEENRAASPMTREPSRPGRSFRPAVRLDKRTLNDPGRGLESSQSSTCRLSVVRARSRRTIVVAVLRGMIARAAVAPAPPMQGKAVGRTVITILAVRTALAVGAMRA